MTSRKTDRRYRSRVVPKSVNQKVLLSVLFEARQRRIAHPVSIQRVWSRLVP